MVKARLAAQIWCREKSVARKCTTYLLWIRIEIELLRQLQEKHLK